MALLGAQGSLAPSSMDGALTATGKAGNAKPQLISKDHTRDFLTFILLFLIFLSIPFD